MTKEKEISFIKKEMEAVVSSLEKRDVYNTQVIEELDKLMNLSKYGSVSHVSKVTRLSSMRNYKLRLTEVIEVFKEITDVQAIDNLDVYITNVLTDSKTNLKASTDALNSVEIFTNDYIKNEILVKTYKDLVDLYTEVQGLMKKVKESFIAEAAKEEPQAPTQTPPPPGTSFPTKKTDKPVTPTAPEKETL